MPTFPQKIFLYLSVIVGAMIIYFAWVGFKVRLFQWTVNPTLWGGLEAYGGAGPFVVLGAKVTDETFLDQSSNWWLVAKGILPVYEEKVRVKDGTEEFTLLIDGRAVVNVERKEGKIIKSFYNVYGDDGSQEQQLVDMDGHGHFVYRLVFTADGKHTPPQRPSRVPDDRCARAAWFKYSVAMSDYDMRKKILPEIFYRGTWQELIYSNGQQGIIDERGEWKSVTFTNGKWQAHQLTLEERGQP